MPWPAIISQEISVLAEVALVPQFIRLGRLPGRSFGAAAGTRVVRPPVPLHEGPARGLESATLAFEKDGGGGTEAAENVPPGIDRLFDDPPVSARRSRRRRAPGLSFLPRGPSLGRARLRPPATPCRLFVVLLPPFRTLEIWPTCRSPEAPRRLLPSRFSRSGCVSSRTSFPPPLAALPARRPGPRPGTCRRLRIRRSPAGSTPLAVSSATLQNPLPILLGARTSCGRSGHDRADLVNGPPDCGGRLPRRRVRSPGTESRRRPVRPGSRRHAGRREDSQRRLPPNRTRVQAPFPSLPP